MNSGVSSSGVLAVFRSPNIEKLCELMRIEAGTVAVLREGVQRYFNIEESGDAAFVAEMRVDFRVVVEMGDKRDQVQRELDELAARIKRAVERQKKVGQDRKELQGERREAWKVYERERKRCQGELSGVQDKIDEMNRSFAARVRKVVEGNQTGRLAVTAGSNYALPLVALPSVAQVPGCVSGFSSAGALSGTSSCVGSLTAFSTVGTSVALGLFALVCRWYDNSTQEFRQQQRERQRIQTLIDQKGVQYGILKDRFDQREENINETSVQLTSTISLANSGRKKLDGARAHLERRVGRIRERLCLKTIGEQGRILAKTLRQPEQSDYEREVGNGAVRAIFRSLLLASTNEQGQRRRTLEGGGGVAQLCDSQKKDSGSV